MMVKPGETKCPKCGLGYANPAALQKHLKRKDSLQCGANREYKGNQ